MTDLRKAAELALGCLDNAIAYSNQELHQQSEARIALREALENEPEAIIELRKLMQEPGVTGILFEVHRGPLSKSIREYGECSCPTNKQGDVMLEVEHD